jgi:hypothetical protein
MPPTIHHRAPAPAQTIPQPAGDRRTLRAFSLPGLVMKEVRATQTHPDLGMTAQMHKLFSRIVLAAAPALRPAARTHRLSVGWR